MNSKSITVLVAEDEDLIREDIVRLLEKHWPSATVIAQAHDGEEAVELWEQHQPDVVVLDIQMPGMNGLQAAKIIADAREGKTKIVFITAYNEHALAAFDAGAVDYLLKPVKEDRLKQTIERLELQINERDKSTNTGQGDISAMLEKLTLVMGRQVAVKEPMRWISASIGNQIKLITVDEVIYFQSDNKYTRIVLANGDALVRKPLRELLDELDEGIFKQVHRSTVVNFNAISSVVRDGTGKGTIKFKSIKDEVDVSAAYMSVFRAL
jgi:DNA-binding LytR/AlgR family response regulator